MTHEPPPHIPNPQDIEDAGRYFRYMSEFVGFSAEDAQAIRKSALIIEKYLPTIIGRFYTNLLQYPPTRKFFVKKDGRVDQAYLELRMYHQANFWRRTAGGEYGDEYAHFVDYVGRAHTSHGADPRLYIAERYVIGMVGFVQHAIVDALQRELHDYDPQTEMAAVKAWNKLCMVILEMLSRAYGGEREAESYEGLIAVDPQAVHDLSVQSYEKSLGIGRVEIRDVIVAQEDEIPDGERKLVEVAGMSIGVFHHKGAWYSLRNYCLHRGGPVATGRLIDDNIVCPWHGYTYNVTNGCLLLDPSAKLDTYPVTVRSGQVWLRVPVRTEIPEPFEASAFGEAVKAVAAVVATTADASGEAPAAPSVAVQSEPSDAATQLEAAAASEPFRLADIQPGQIKLVQMAGQRVAVYNLDGQYFATAEECTHVGGPLSQGQLKGKEVVCPWHGSCFDVTTGAVTRGPAEEPLKTYPVVIEGEFGKVTAP